MIENDPSHPMTCKFTKILVNDLVSTVTFGLTLIQHKMQTEAT